MATKKSKKSKKKSSKSAGKKSGKKVAKKAAKRVVKKSAKKAKRSASNLGPKPVKTGGGASPMQVAKNFSALIRAGRIHDAEARLLSPSIESVEGVGASMAWNGKRAVLAKYRAWEADHEIHDMQIAGPWVGATGFAVRYNVDVTQKSTGQRNQMEEIAVYTVRNGKIVREEFHFGVGG